MSENEQEKDKQPGNGAEESAQSGTENLKSELDKAKKEYLYLLADFDNYRKNAIKERSELIRYGAERLIRELLAVTDNFERALENDADPAKFREGVQMISQEFKSLLQKHGVAEVPAEGQPFDPSMHEALSSEPSSKIKEGHVATVFKKAYKLHDKLIRPAQVTVATKPAKTGEGEES